MIKKQISILFQLIQFLGCGIKKHIFYAFSAGLFPVLYNLIMAFVLKNVYSAIQARTSGKIADILLLFVFSIIGLLLFNSMAWFRLRSSTAGMTGNLRKAMLRKLCTLPASYIDGIHSGDILTYFTYDVATAESIYSQNIRYPIAAILCGIVSSIIVFWLSWQMGIIIFGTALLQLAFNLSVVRPVKKISSRIQNQMASVNKILSDILACQLSIRLNCTESYYSELYREKSLELYKLSMRRSRIGAFITVGNVFFGMGSYVLALAIGSLMVEAGYFDFSLLLFITQLRLMMMQTVTTLGDFAVQSQPSVAGAERILSFLNHDIENELPSGL